LVSLSSPCASASLSSPSPTVAKAESEKSPTDACPVISRSPAAQRVSARKPEPSISMGPVNSGPMAPCCKRPDTETRFPPGSTAFSRSTVTPPSLLVSSMSSPPIRSPPRPAWSMSTASAPSPIEAASSSTHSANMYKTAAGGGFFASPGDPNSASTSIQRAESLPSALDGSPKSSTRLPFKICGRPSAWTVRSKSGNSARSGAALSFPFNSTNDVVSLGPLGT